MIPFIPYKIQKIAYKKTFLKQFEEVPDPFESTTELTHIHIRL